MDDRLKGRRPHDPTKCGSEREEGSKSQNKHMGRRGIQDLHRLDEIQERERKNLKREQDKLRQEYMKGRQGLSPSVDSYLDHQIGKRTGMRQKEYELIAKRAEVRKRAIMDPEGFARKDEDSPSSRCLDDAVERNGRTNTNRIS